ncbi:EF-P 5-aminopentanol modification-associated protein YfmF [Companilactobacillus baiquanensis]|uniref:EF-P 5-aminopentanol modification-associated protein YfmF n=1 Tax=Companilactobacillus baiquanensis TaxID=2486005 RepID=A0ABW1UWW7_9LACO|nr:pitrilysin family protein [Companilactobacillus baiquanensis]
MKQEIAKNVILNIDPINKFRTIKIQIDFLRPLDKEETTTRRLLANVLSNSTKSYPSFRSLNDREMELYGSEINVYTRNLLNLNDLAFSIEFADPKFLLDGDDLLKDNIDLLSKIIFDPNLKNDHEFSDDSFDTEKRNLMSNLASVDDNQDLVSMLKLSSLIHHDNPDKQIPIFGDMVHLNSLTNQDLYEHYKKAIKEDTIIINVVGDVDEKMFLKIMDNSFMSTFLKRDRCNSKVTFDSFENLIDHPLTQSEHKHLNQSRLALAYVTEKIDPSFSYLAPQAMNLILGGDDQSKLFLQVREKNSLAYSVSSTYHPISHLMTIQAGLDAKSVDQAMDLINKQIDAVQKGQFTQSQIEHAKKVLSTRRKISSDSIQYYIMHNIWEDVYPKSLLDDEHYQAELDKLDKDHIIKVAQGIHDIAQYRLIGD